MNLGQNIQDLIPQRPPFVMIDKLLHSDEKHTITGFRVNEGNIFVENGEFREPGLIENIAQTAAAGAGYKSRFSNDRVAVGYIGSIRKLEIFALPKINDELITEISIEDRVFNVIVISGRACCNDKIMAQCEIKIFINDAV